MKLVKGKTLAALLSERSTPVADAPGAPSDLARFLDIASRVAQTLAYAHAKGVIHRDLKPANIMVGAFGEVQVMDWGLAKVLPEGGVADEEKANRQHQPEEGTLIRTARSGSTGTFGTDTEAGTLLGTPAYMPPEQAQGDVALLDRRADVFGLGAILCEILTGRPPFVGRSSEEVRRKAANGDLTDALARLDACGADQELIALTRACLQPEASDRPRDAHEVADGLSAYLDGVQQRLQTAQRERAVALAREAEQRKRRKVQLALAAALVALLLGGGAFAFWRNEQAQAGREREARNAEAVAALLGQAEEALKADDAAKAQVTLDAAKKRSAEGGADKEAQRLARLEADLALVRDLDAIDQFRWTVVENTFPDAAAVARRTRKALGRFGADPKTVSADEAAARVSASVVRERIVAALDRLLRQERAAGVRAVLRRVDAHPYCDAVRDAVRGQNKAKLVELARRKEALEQPPGFVVFLGESGAIPVERQRHLLAAALSGRPGDVGLLMTLGLTYPLNQEEGANERSRWFQAAVAAAPGNVAAHTALGIALRDKKDLAAAEAAHRKAIDLDPKFAPAHLNLSIALAGKGQVEEAIACCRKAIALDPKFAVAHSNLGAILCDNKRDYDGAIACFKRAIALDPKYAPAHSNLGTALAAKGLVEEAIACYQKAIKLDPKYAKAHFKLGKALYGKGQVEEAIACFRKVIAIDPKHADAHSHLGTILCDFKRDFDGAIGSFKKVSELTPKDAVAHFNLGNALSGKGRLDEAIACWRKAIALDPKLAEAHTNLGLALAGKGKADEAIACYQKAIALEPKDATAHNNLGSLLCDVKRDYDGAIACFKRAIALDPKYANAHRNLGVALRGKGQVEEAISCFRKAIALDPKHAKAHYNLGNELLGKRQLDEAIASYRKAIALDPKYAFAHYGLGLALARKGKADEAIASYREAIALDPQFADAHYSLGLALKDKGQLEEAIASYRKAIALDPKFANAHGALGEVLLWKGHYAEARDASARALALLSEGHPMRALASGQVQECKRLLKLEKRLPELLRGEDKPASALEGLDLARLCHLKHLNAAAVRFAAAAFTAEPKLADDLQAGHRSNAACCAALAAAGKGKDAAKLDAKERARLRQQSLDWLRADLALRGKQLQSGKPADRAAVQRALRHWQKDSDLAGLRDKEALTKLPAEEQKVCTQLWADVAALRKKAETGAKKEGKR
jgi:tetratricopeptide (TPR) repeat protein